MSTEPKPESPAELAAEPHRYAERDIIALDRAGGYYFRHVFAMTRERLYDKSDIAAELAWRDMEIDRLAALATIQASASASQEPVARIYTTVYGNAAVEWFVRPSELPPDTLLYTAATQARPASGEAWQPISSAPKDGTEILLWREDCGQFIGSYTSGDNFPLTQDEIDSMAEEVLFQKDWFTQWPDARRLEGSEVPTLWQYLPAAPTSTPSAAKKD